MLIIGYRCLLTHYGDLYSILRAHVKQEKKNNTTNLSCKFYMRIVAAYSPRYTNHKWKILVREMA